MLDRRLVSGFPMNPGALRPAELCCLSLNIHEISYCILLRRPPSQKPIGVPHRLALVPNNPKEAWPVPLLNTLCYSIVEVQPYLAENKAI